jgi:hypothetical protein
MEKLDQPPSYYSTPANTIHPMPIQPQPLPTVIAVAPTAPTGVFDFQQIAVVQPNGLARSQFDTAMPIGLEPYASRFH